MYRSFLKRVFDILFSIMLMPLFFILLIIVGIAIKIEDRGPIFYTADRLGKHGKVYKMYKFRSMKVYAPDIRNEDGSTYNSKDDPRLTRIGKFIRETSIDEIPQILNIIVGNMSLIGPRPNLPDDYDTFQDDELPKLSVLPGITGYTQAYYRNSISVRDRRLNDAWYAENYSFSLDIKIFIRTIITVIKRDGIYTNKDNESSNIGA